MKTMNNSDFEPIFIVGPVRSGTTMLAVLFDRHSRIAVPPETQFYSEFLRKMDKADQYSSHEKKVDLALSFTRIADLNLERDKVLEIFLKYPSTYDYLLRAILEAYTSSQGKTRPADKTPSHITYVPRILKAYPSAKIICIVRDGRDAVLSMLKTKWRTGNPRRFKHFCTDWADAAKLALDYEKKLPAERFTMVKYETFLQQPEKELKRLCEFVGENYEPSQFDTEINTGAVPSWENAIKSKAKAVIDPSRAHAWRRTASPEQIWIMHSLMGKTLRRMGYMDDAPQRCPLFKRITLAIQHIPYWRPLRPLSLFGLRILRHIKYRIFFIKDN